MSYFYNNLLHEMAVLSYLLKLKKDLALDFGAHFQHNFSIKMFLI